MVKKQISPFELKCGEDVYRNAILAIEEYGMAPMLKEGVLVGLSGGADSVLLLYFLKEYRRRNFDFPIVAVHINHCIRGDEADRDEAFAARLAAELDVEFVSVKVDVPALARESSQSMEEAARNARYAEFDRIISSRNDISAIAVAHNSTDNLETVLFNIMRGAGARGASGIPPVRDNILRPLIYVSKEQICDLLSEAGIEYVTDSTNLSTDYTRNFLRHSVIGKLREIIPSPEMAASRLSRNLRRDDECLCALADEFLQKNPKPLSSDLSVLPEAIFARVVMGLAKRYGSSLEEIHVKAIRSHLCGGDFSLSIPGGVSFVCERGECYISSDERDSDDEQRFTVSSFKTELSGYDADLFVFEDKNKEIYRNVYKISIQACLSSAIIDGGLYVRFKRDGDSIFYSGHTHKLKKVFNDLKIPKSKRSRIPLLCDNKGVVWVPGLAVRDDSPAVEERREVYAAICIGRGAELSEKRAYLLSEFRINTK